MSRLDEIRARLEAAGKNEWGMYGRPWGDVGGRYTLSSASKGAPLSFQKKEAEFIVCSRDDMAMLLAVVDAERAGWSPSEIAEELQESVTKERRRAWPGGIWEKHITTLDRKLKAWQALA